MGAILGRLPGAHRGDAASSRNLKPMGFTKRAAAIAGKLGGMKGGKSCSPKKRAASRANGAKGGRPPVVWRWPKRLTLYVKYSQASRFRKYFTEVVSTRDLHRLIGHPVSVEGTRQGYRELYTMFDRAMPDGVYGVLARRFRCVVTITDGQLAAVSYDLKYPPRPS